jgi:cold shock CspA family protein
METKSNKETFLHMSKFNNIEFIELDGIQNVKYALKL